MKVAIVSLIVVKIQIHSKLLLKGIPHFRENRVNKKLLKRRAFCLFSNI
jgi:hypothetical protein